MILGSFVALASWLGLGLASLGACIDFGLWQGNLARELGACAEFGGAALLQGWDDGGGGFDGVVALHLVGHMQEEAGMFC